MTLHLDRTPYLDRLGDPTTWSGDWRRQGNYLNKEQQHATASRMRQHEPLLVGMAIRGNSSKVIAAVLGVSRESVDRRLRPLGFKNLPGQVGRPLGAISKCCTARNQWVEPPDALRYSADLPDT